MSPAKISDSEKSYNIAMNACKKDVLNAHYHNSTVLGKIWTISNTLMLIIF